METINENIKKGFENFSINYRFNNSTKLFDSYSNFRNFLETEVTFWKDYKEGILLNNMQTYGGILNRLNSILPVIDEKQIIAEIDSLKNILISGASKNLLYSDAPISQFLTDLYIRHPERINSAFSIVLENKVDHIEPYNKFALPSKQSIDAFWGIFEAYRFLSGNEDKELEPFIEEKYNRIFTKYITSINDTKNDYDKLKSKFESELTDSIREYQDNNKEFRNKINGYEENFKGSNKGWHEKVESLETMYHEKLRLAAPAHYWCQLKLKYNKEGMGWIYGSFLLSTAFLLILCNLLYNLPTWLKGKFELEQFKGIIIFTLIISTFSYLIHLFIKLATSALHLSRDSGEREQLTYVYLSLLNDKAIDPSERQIILQSLFSRSDTGLLKTDGAPSMPNVGPINEFFKVIGKK